VQEKAGSFITKCELGSNWHIIDVDHFRKGDYYRYVAEFSSGDKRQDAANKSLAAYTVANGTFICLWKMYRVLRIFSYYIQYSFCHLHLNLRIH
jgi:hypothetical protein